MAQSADCGTIMKGKNRNSTGDIGGNLGKCRSDGECDTSQVEKDPGSVKTPLLPSHANTHSRPQSRDQLQRRLTTTGRPIPDRSLQS